MRLSATMAALALTAAAAVARAQDFTAMNDAFNARLNAQMAQTQHGIVQSNLNDPRVMAMYRRYRAQGGTMTAQQFAYKYAATGGFTPQGYANYNRVTGQTNAQQKQAMADAGAGLQSYRNAYGGYTAGYAADQQEAGRGLSGSQTYYDPASGRDLQLQYLQPGQAYTDPRSGRTYEMDARGRYWSSRGDGNWSAVDPAVRAPR